MFDSPLNSGRALRINAALRRQDGSPAPVLGVDPAASFFWHASAEHVAFAECGAAPSAVFACRCSFSWRLADDLFLAAAGVSGDPVSAWQRACPVAVDISCRLQRCWCLEA